MTTSTTHPSLHIDSVRRHFVFPQTGRVVTNNAASTQPARELLDLFNALAPAYENVHRGQSTASRTTTARFEESYDTIAQFIGAADRSNLVVTRNTTEAHNTVMYSLMTEFRAGDNVVTTMMEHNSNYVPWYALSREILPKFGRPIEYRIARFDPATGALDLGHLASLIDKRTKLVCCTSASNFLGVRNPIATIRELASCSGYVQPDGQSGSYLLVDGAQLVPSTFVDVRQLDVDFLSFSCHKMLAPFGVGVLYAKRHLLERMRPFLYGGDMIATGQVTPDLVEYNDLPWKFAAGTPNILATIVSAQALRLLVDLALTPDAPRLFLQPIPLVRADLEAAMGVIGEHTRRLTAVALERLHRVPGLKIYGPMDVSRRTSLVAFNIDGHDPFAIAEALNEMGIESRAGCHCATLAHRALGLQPPASCRLSFYVYNTVDEVERACEAVASIARRRVTSPARFQQRDTGDDQHDAADFRGTGRLLQDERSQQIGGDRFETEHDDVRDRHRFVAHRERLQSGADAEADEHQRRRDAFRQAPRQLHEVAPDAIQQCSADDEHGEHRLTLVSRYLKLRNAILFAVDSAIQSLLPRRFGG
jgi:cysteine desulfurase/selenocysteine lyase